jgi:hypothetical protein
MRFDFVPDKQQCHRGSPSRAMSVRERAPSPSLKRALWRPRLIASLTIGLIISGNSAGYGSGRFLTAMPEPWRPLKDFMIKVICHGLPQVRSRLAVSGALPERT